MATTRPKRVVMRASEIPPARGFGSPEPKRVMRLKVEIMPETVPRRPRSGGIEVADGAASAFGLWYTRRLGAGRWSWLVPLGVVAFGPVHPRYCAAALFAALVGWQLVRPVSRRTGLITGSAWGGLCLFGLDMAGNGAVILVGGWVLARSQAPRRSARPGLPFTGIAAGLSCVLGLAVVTCLALGVLGTAFWDTAESRITLFPFEFEEVGACTTASTTQTVTRHGDILFVCSTIYSLAIFLPEGSNLGA